MELAGNTFLVTGAASGLGAGVARALVAAGGRVLLADIDAAGGAALADELGKATQFVRTDVTAESEVERAIGAATDSFGPIAGVVQCAGILGAARI
ncbi:MAG TPA: SDR family NAD(P)-dependent oxidoreductase, partial [Pirellulales bacterium]|nr:SDR family NAD(P)-dependent oxidoreductase [Pirellulales bacterium]